MTQGDIQMFSEEFVNSLVEDAKDVWPKKWPVIEKHFQRCCLAISYDIVCNYFGLFQKKGDEETFSSIRDKIELNPDAEYTFQKCLDILVEDNILSTEGGKYICLETDPDIQSAAEWLVEAVREVPEEGAAFQWLARGFDGLYRFFKGKLSGEEAMFGPWSDFELVGQVYYTSEVYGFWSKLAGKTVKRLIESEFNRKVSILEVGAGTGNGTFEMFKTIGSPEEKIDNYIFTDIHRRLVKKTSKNFTDYPFMDFKALDLTKPLNEQEMDNVQVDILYAVNVMHALNDISEACQTMYKLVNDDGFVVLGEISPPKGKLYRYMELTFGLLASYFQYDDKELRPDSPILRPEQWIEHLKKAGFKEAIAIPGDRVEGSDRGGSIIAKK